MSVNEKQKYMYMVNQDNRLHLPDKRMLLSGREQALGH